MSSANPTPAGSPPGGSAPAGTTEQFHRRWQAALMDTYGTPPLALARGEGAQVWDVEGRRYLDLLGGLAVNALGHAHPAVLAAVTEQLGTLGHVSNLYITDPAVTLAETLLDLLGSAGSGRVFFANSGAEAIEAAFKIARRTGRRKVVCCEGAFHGRTMGALTLTGQPAKRDPFEPLVPGVEFVPYGDPTSLASAVDADTAAVFLEPVQGENGVVIPPEGYLQAARHICSERGALLVLDEVQTGIGRTGAWFAHQTAGVVPDVVTVAKGLGGGLPIGACVGLGAAGGLLQPGQHGSTFGGNPVCCAAALAVIRTIAAEGLLDHAAQLGKHIATRITAIRDPLIGSVSQMGLLVGVGLTDAVAPALTTAAREWGFLINPATPQRIRLAPPLVLTEAQAEEFLTALPAILDAGR